MTALPEDVLLLRRIFLRGAAEPLSKVEALAIIRGHGGNIQAWAMPDIVLTLLRLLRDDDIVDAVLSTGITLRDGGDNDD